MYQRTDFDKVFYVLKDREDLKDIYKQFRVNDGDGVVELVKDEDVFIDSFEQSLSAFINYYESKPPKMVSKVFRIFLTKVINQVMSSGVYSKPLSGRDILLFQMYHKRIDLGENEVLKINDIVSFSDFVRLYNDFFEGVFNESEFKNESLGSKLNLLTGIMESFYINKLLQMHGVLDNLDKKDLPSIEEYLEELKEFILSIG